MSYTILCFVFVTTFLIPIYYGSRTVISYGSGSDFFTSYRYGSGSGSTWQKVTVPTVPVPQHWHIGSQRVMSEVEN
jgi:hypothetical protein